MADPSDEPGLESAYALRTEEDTKRLYRNWAESYDQDFVAGAAYRHPEIVARRYRALGGLWPCLDVGCGTGAVAAHMGPKALIDGLDLSPEMLAVARRKRLYRALIEANLKEPLPLDDAAYAGLVSSGTFTHGHVGAEALPELIRILRPGGLAVFTVKSDLWEGLGFADALRALEQDGRISPPERIREPIYAAVETAPEGHAGDTGYIVSLTRL